ncbi:MAG TPA: ABC transporter permease [Acidobacteriota bacterium]|nr:ABC transporter permease [Acidobacteriota bacterium]
MLSIARLKMLDGLRDAKFLFLATLVVLAFLFNGIVGAEHYRLEREGYLESIAQNIRGLENNCSNLQLLATFQQHFQKPPSPLAFVAEGGGRMLPNSVVMNVFARYESAHEQRGNYKLPLLNSVDWNFIIGGLMAMLAIVISFGSVSGEKRDGTLRQMLANPVSRLSLFAGNYLGLLAVALAALVLGVVFNLVALELLDGPPLSGEILLPLAWSFFFSILYISLFILVGMAASAMTSRPAVALVILLVFWVLAVVAAPGVSRLLSEQMVEIPLQQWVTEEQGRVYVEIWNSYPPIIGRFTGDPFEPHMPMRAEANQRICEAQQRVRDGASAARVQQVLLAQGISWISPYGLLSDSLQMSCGTGIHGFNLLRDNAERYRRILHDFVVERDRQDSTSAHLVYGNRDYEYRTFSTKEVPLVAVPRSSAMWSAAGLVDRRETPWWQMIWLLLYNLTAGLVSFTALMRYDPR